MIFTAKDYNTLADLVLRSDYPGYRPDVLEAPNGDGRIDRTKRYAHVADKYLEALPCGWNNGAIDQLDEFLFAAYTHACRVAEDLGVPNRFLPSWQHGALRVLDYPPGAGSELHTDFCLFTVMCYRDDPDALVRKAAYPARLDAVDPGLHVGEIGELVGLGRATPHYVLPRPQRQRSIVYFAIPHHAAVLPDGTTVGEWLRERTARSRYDAKGVGQ